MKQFLQIFRGIFLTMLIVGGLSEGIFAQEYSPDAVQCPTKKQCKVLGIFNRSTSFQNLQDVGHQACDRSELYIQNLETNLADLKVLFPRLGAERETTLTNLKYQFKQAASLLDGANERCQKNSRGKNIGYEDATKIFKQIHTDTEFQIRAEIDRLNTEGLQTYAQALADEFRNLSGIYINPSINSIPSSSSVFSGNGALFGYETNLTDYTGSKDTGREQFRGLVETVLDFLKRATVPIGLFLVVFAGAQLIIMKGENDEELQQKKREMIFQAGTGYAIFFLAVNIVDFVVFGQQGEIFQGTDVNSGADFAKRGFLELYGIFNFLETMVVIVAVAFIVVRSYQLVVGNADGSAQDKAKKQVISTVIAVALIISIRPVLRIFTQNGRIAVPNATSVIELMAKWADYALLFVGFFGVVGLVYAGIRMITDFGNGEAQESAKKIAMYAAIGIVVAFSTWTIINFFANPSGTGLQTSFDLS